MSKEKAPTQVNEQRLNLDLCKIKFSTPEEAGKAGMNNHDLLIRKHASKPGLRGKIDAKCIECIYDPYQSGSWRIQVEKCSSLTCPLYSVRPKSGGA